MGGKKSILFPSILFFCKSNQNRKFPLFFFHFFFLQSLLGSISLLLPLNFYPDTTSKLLSVCSSNSFFFFLPLISCPSLSRRFDSLLFSIFLIFFIFRFLPYFFSLFTSLSPSLFPPIWETEIFLFLHVLSVFSILRNRFPIHSWMWKCVFSWSFLFYPDTSFSGQLSLFFVVICLPSLSFICRGFLFLFPCEIGLHSLIPGSWLNKNVQ